jgi:hypothetical protein
LLLLLVTAAESERGGEVKEGGGGSGWAGLGQLEAGEDGLGSSRGGAASASELEKTTIIRMEDGVFRVVVTHAYTKYELEDKTRDKQISCCIGRK